MTKQEHHELLTRIANEKPGVFSLTHHNNAVFGGYVPHPTGLAHLVHHAHQLQTHAAIAKHVARLDAAAKVGAKTSPSVMLPYSFQKYDRGDIGKDGDQPGNTIVTPPIYPTQLFEIQDPNDPSKNTYTHEEDVGALSLDATLETFFEVLAAKGVITDLQQMPAYDNTGDSTTHGQELGKYIKGFTYTGPGIILDPNDTNWHYSENIDDDPLRYILKSLMYYTNLQQNTANPGSVPTAMVNYPQALPPQFKLFTDDSTEENKILRFTHLFLSLETMLLDLEQLFKTSRV
jgi:hypothetical protein